MLPLALLGTWMCAGEFLGLYRQADAHAEASGQGRHGALPEGVVVCGGALVVVAASTGPVTIGWPDGGTLGDLGWIALGLVTALLLVLLHEMRYYAGPASSPGVITLRVTRAMFAILYAGGLMGFVILLRVLSGGEWGSDARWGMLALLTTIAVVKCNDSGAYIVGHALGKHRMTPLLSPGKTWEGFAGGFLGAIAAAIVFLGPIATLLGCESQRTTTHWLVGVLLYAVIVGLAGVAGDLAISLMKRDAGVKDSSTWMPGFGGFLDLLDSILLAAPVSYFLWRWGVVGP